MSLSVNDEAEKEIADSLSLCLFCMHRIGFNFNEPTRVMAYYGQKTYFIICVFSICYHIYSEFACILITFWTSPRIEKVVPLLHIFGYGILTVTKLFVLWYKKDEFKQLIKELADIWPVPPLDENTQNIKNKSLTGLRVASRWYVILNLSGVAFFTITPIGVYIFRQWQGQNVKLGFIWVAWYPFDKNKLIAHIAVYIFETITGQACVYVMISTDLLLSAMASHIGMLLRLLQCKLQSIGSTKKTDEEYFDAILSNIKLHQRLIRYCNNLEEAFSLVNLINILFSSLNICCVLFTIVVLEPFMFLSNKLFLASSLIQIGLICWYADDIYHANENVAMAAYNSKWYKTSPRCRLALLFLIQRSQKPIAFTAMKFTNISLKTYSTILTKSYSYFALLYTMYSDNREM